MEERENPKILKEVTISETLSKIVPITTQDYKFCGYDRGEENWEKEEIIADFSDTNWLEEYLSDNYSVTELLEKIPKFLMSIYPILDKENQSKARHWIEACKGWNQDEIEAVI